MIATSARHSITSCVSERVLPRRVEIWIGAPKLTDQLHGDRRRRKADRHAPPLQSAEQVGGHLEVVDAADDQSRPRIELASCVGQVLVLGAAVQQADAADLFQRVDLIGDVGLGHTQHGGRAREGALIHDRDEGLQGPDRQAAGLTAPATLGAILGRNGHDSLFGRCHRGPYKSGP